MIVLSRPGGVDEGLAGDLGGKFVGLAGRIEACAEGALEARPRVAVVEADVEARCRRTRNDVRRLVADVDRGELQTARLEVIRALVQLQREQGIEQDDEAGQGVVRQRRIGDVPLTA